MYDALGAANQRLAGAVSDAVQPKVELEMRQKQATDAAFITRAQTAMEAATLDFQNWAKTNPDPNTWDEELKFRISDTKKKVEDGAKGLAPIAQERLALVINDWEIGTQKRVQLQATDQKVQVAQASFNDYVQMAIQNNDLDAVVTKVAEGVQAGIYNPKTAQSIVSRARQNVTMNVANQLIELDPFEARARLEAKDEKGNYTNFPEMSEVARTNLLLYKVARAEREQRGQALKEWGQQMRDFRDGVGPMPDEAGVRAAAKEMRIAPSDIDRLFKPTVRFDAAGYAAVMSGVMTYKPSEDQGFIGRAELEARIYGLHLPAQAQTELLDALKTQAKGGDRNTAVSTAFFTRAKEQHDQGLFLPGTVERVKVPGSGILGTSIGADKKDQLRAPSPEERATWKKDAPQAVLDAEAVRYTDYLTKMRAFFAQKPDATDLEAEAYARELRKPYVMESVAAMLTQRPAKTGAKVISTEEEFRLLPPGAAFIWNGTGGTKK